MKLESEHWSSPNGCHPDCPACAAESEADGSPSCAACRESGANQRRGRLHLCCDCAKAFDLGAKAAKVRIVARVQGGILESVTCTAKAVVKIIDADAAAVGNPAITEIIAGRLRP